MPISHGTCLSSLFVSLLMSVQLFYTTVCFKNNLCYVDKARYMGEEGICVTFL
jgi:hypothetical protein